METPIEKAQRVNRERHESGEATEVTHNWIVKAKRMPNSLKRAINAKCFECVGGTEDSLPDPGWKKTISGCTAPDCPLHPHRPYQKITLDDTEDNDSDQD